MCESIQAQFLYSLRIQAHHSYAIRVPVFLNRTISVSQELAICFHALRCTWKNQTSSWSKSPAQSWMVRRGEGEGGRGDKWREGDGKRSEGSVSITPPLSSYNAASLQGTSWGKVVLFSEVTKSLAAGKW